jgi:hypothetical protein
MELPECSGRVRVRVRVRVKDYVRAGNVAT